MRNQFKEAMLPENFFCEDDISRDSTASIGVYTSLFSSSVVK